MIIPEMALYIEKNEIVCFFSSFLPVVTAIWKTAVLARRTSLPGMVLTDTSHAHAHAEIWMGGGWFTLKKSPKKNLFSVHFYFGNPFGIPFREKARKIPYALKKSSNFCKI